MKLQELKHNHSLTDLLKIILFSILMLLPFLSVATRCLYVICNKNAYESYSGTSTTYQQITTRKETNNNSITAATYYFLDDVSYSDIFNYLDGESVDFSELVLKFSVKYGKVSDDFNVADLYVFDDATLYVEFNFLDDTVVMNYGGTYDFDDYLTASIVGVIYIHEVTGLNQDIDNYLLSLFEDATTYLTNINALYDTNYIEIESTTLDNVFEYSMQKMAEDPMFNWTQNTALYTGVKAMTDNLEIQTPVIAVLIVYWFILTIIYIIIDITLKLFTYLTHGIFHKS